MIDKIYTHFIKIGLPVSTDSRNIIPGSIFFGLKGENFNGSKYAADAIKRGASLAIIDNDKYKTDQTILVDDTLLALQQLATMYRKKADFKVIALTGTNGKTTTKELIRLVLSEKYVCHSTKGNLNNHIGVPLTILSAPANTELLIVEMGANHIGEISSLCEIAQPDYGLITNIGKAHLEGFGGFEGVIKAKSELYAHLVANNKLIFLNKPDSILTSLVGDYPKVEFYGSKDSLCYANSIVFDGQLSVNISIGGNTHLVCTQMFGKYNVTNILTAIKVGAYFNVDIKKIMRAIEKYTPENNRSQLLKTPFNTLILDSYNANPSSMQIALESFSEINTKNKISILGEMKELGTSSYEEHKFLIDKATHSGCLKNIFVGNEFIPFIKNPETFFKNTDELIDYLKKEKITDKLIFIKGSRSNQLEKIIPFL
jgi:UDP-N-acetylmuramoyl-tripeptide--D-alanyl-D-alanine ligase